MEFDGPIRNHRRNRVFVNHLTYGILQQYDKLIEGLDLPLQLDSVHQKDGYRYVLLA